MYQKLLEKPDQIIFNLFQYLSSKKSSSLDETAKNLKLTPKSLQRYIRLWQQNGSSFTSGISFVVKKQKITLNGKAKNKRLFLNFLLRRSQCFQLLVQVTADPYCKLKNLSTSQYLSTTTIQRYFKKMKTFLTEYQLFLSFTTNPALKGNELQIRYFSFIISLLHEPPIIWSSQILYERYMKIQRNRINSGFSVTESQLAPINRYYAIPFQINDQALAFLWSQLLGVENLWIDPSLRKILEFALVDHAELEPQSLIKLMQKFHQLHSICAIFEGRLFPFSDISNPSDKTQKIVQSFIHSIPSYQKLLKQHPELPFAYEKLLQNESNKSIIAEK